MTGNATKAEVLAFFIQQVNLAGAGIDPEDPQLNELADELMLRFNVRKWRTDAEIIQQTEKLATEIMGLCGWKPATHAVNVRDSQNPRSRQAWQIACEAQEQLTQTEVPEDEEGTDKVLFQHEGVLLNEHLNVLFSLLNSYEGKMEVQDFTTGRGFPLEGMMTEMSGFSFDPETSKNRLKGPGAHDTIDVSLNAEADFILRGV